LKLKRKGSLWSCQESQPFFCKNFLIYFGMSKVFSNPKQLEEWVATAVGIQERYGPEKALGYIIGEKFYNLVETLHSAQKIIRAIDEEPKTPDFNPIRVTKYKDRELVTNLNETYEEEKEIVIEAGGLLVKFVFLISQAFSPHEIRKYFKSHPRLGALGHITSEEEQDFLVRHGAVEYSLDMEVEDALIFGDMMKYFGVSA
jgi:hypothetical protein